MFALGPIYNIDDNIIIELDIILQDKAEAT
jgi:hypothetical protein